MSAVSLTYFTAAPECLGILWKAIGWEMAAYYPIAVVAGIAAAIGLMTFYLKTIKKYEGKAPIED